MVLNERKMMLKSFYKLLRITNGKYKVVRRVFISAKTHFKLNSLKEFSIHLLTKWNDNKRRTCNRHDDETIGHIT